jgi:hypothetical protein
MQLTTILAVLFSCLVLFASVSFTNSSGIKGQRPAGRPNPFVKLQDNHAVRQENLFKSGGRQFSARAIAETLKKRRKPLINYM